MLQGRYSCRASGEQISFSGTWNDFPWGAIPVSNRRCSITVAAHQRLNLQGSLLRPYPQISQTGSYSRNNFSYYNGVLILLQGLNGQSHAAYIYTSGTTGNWGHRSWAPHSLSNYYPGLPKAAVITQLKMACKINIFGNHGERLSKFH